MRRYLNLNLYLHLAQILTLRQSIISLICHYFSHYCITQGTLYFMAIEVEQHRYAFKPLADLSNFESIVFHDMAPFQYNYLHDLESLYWILIFILVIKWPQSSPPSKEHHRSFSDIFLSGVENRKKFLLCDDSDVITDIYTSAADDLKDGWRQTTRGSVQNSGIRMAQDRKGILPQSVLGGPGHGGRYQARRQSGLFSGSQAPAVR